MAKKTIAQQIESAQNAINSAETEMRASVARSAALIATLKAIPEMFASGEYSPHSAYCDGHITMEPVDTIADAILIAERANPAAMGKFRDGSVSFRPLGKCPQGKGETETVCPYAVNLEGLAQYRQTLELFFFVESDGKIFQIRIPVKSQEIKRSYRRVEYRGGVRYEDVRAYDETGHFPRQIKWAAGSSEYVNNFTFYA